MPTRIVLADDHPTVRKTCAELILHARGLQLVATCTNGEEALATVWTYDPDVLVLDLEMPRMDGLAVLRQLHEEGAATKVVLLASAPADGEVFSAIQYGVKGIVL